MPNNEQKLNPLGVAAGALLGTVGAWVAYSALGIDHNVELPDALLAERRQFYSGKAGMLSYYVDRSSGENYLPHTKLSNRPLVLLHSINAAGSSYEMRPLFEKFRFVRPTYALDLPGFGFSERSNREYTPELYKDAIIDFLETQVGAPADVVTLSLSSEFAALAALERPDLFNTLSMISPSGFTARGQKRASQSAAESNRSHFIYGLFSFPLWAQGFYDLLGTRASIHYFLQQSFVGPVDPGLEEYAYLTSHRPGARNAPLYFVSGALFTPDIRERVYEHLTIPVLVIYDRDPFVRFDTLGQVLANHDNWLAIRVAPTLGLPQFEQIEETAQVLEGFWSAQLPSTGELDSSPTWVGQDEE
jgi:pimeloyl-ACP methyl ester carboxylesterase